jgi:hypothetical protein
MRDQAGAIADDLEKSADADDVETRVPKLEPPNSHPGEKLPAGAT